LANEKVRDALIEKMKAILTKFYGPNKDSMTRLVNEHHFERVKRLLEEPHNGKVVEGGLDASVNKSKRYIPPTFVVDPSQESTMMQEEIFGPVLPFITVRDLDHALSIIRKKDNPLAAYVFTESEAISKRYFEMVQSGGGCVNDIMAHLRNKHLTLGGTGKSGIGCYGGKFSFDLFSHKQSVVDSTSGGEEARNYPPIHPKIVAMVKANL
jgi:acyl-CoA reductase-like NAD-dependent aldehyde dehydrogenase